MTTNNSICSVTLLYSTRLSKEPLPLSLIQLKFINFGRDPVNLSKVEVSLLGI